MSESKNDTSVCDELIMRSPFEHYQRNRNREPIGNGWKLAVAAALALTVTVDAYATCLELSAAGNQPTYQAASQSGALVSAHKLIPGLFASQSQITGVLDPDTLTGSYYWTYVVHNSTAEQQEAKIDIVVPAGSAVTRATLWINGIPQEAAFSSTENVQRAYNWITRQHRDPLLVTQTSPGHIAIKAAPVMPGRDMQLRLGITTAASLAHESAIYKLPRVESANLAIDCPQYVHVTAPSLMKSNKPTLEVSHGGNDALARGTISLRQLNDLEISASRGTKATQFACRATHSSPAGYIAAKLQPTASGSTDFLLSKTSELPKGTFIASEESAHRLSTLWAYSEIERLAHNYEAGKACELANVYRVVSSVSGATVLETEGDYAYQSLNRDIYKTTSYMPPCFVSPATEFKQQELTQQAAGTQGATAISPYVVHQPKTVRNSALSLAGNVLTLGFVRGALQTTLSSSFSTVTSQLSMLNAYSATTTSGFTNSSNFFNGISSAAPSYVNLSAESLDDSREPQNSSTDTAMSSFAGLLEAEAAFSGSLGQNLVGNFISGFRSGKDTDTFMTRQDLIRSFSTPSNLIISLTSLSLMTLLSLLTFAGPVWMLSGALNKWALSKPFGGRDFMLAICWFFAALLCPEGSQMLVVLLAWAAVTNPSRSVPVTALR